MFLLRTEAGLSATDAGQILGRTGGTVRDLSRLVARRERSADLVAGARRVLEVRFGGRERPSPRWMPRALPCLRLCRVAAGLTQDELAGRARVARETLCKIERGRPATQVTVLRLAAVLAVRPDVLAGTVTGNRFEPEPPFADPESTLLTHVPAGESGLVSP
jgi:DNA-binding XRE family transcriptional regulator